LIFKIDNLDNPGRLEGWKVGQYLPAFQSFNLPGFTEFGYQNSLGAKKGGKATFHGDSSASPQNDIF
jgi:hypothetical protein